MFAIDPVTGALGTLATGAVFGLLVALYREHREPFLLWAVVAWGASLAHAVAQIPDEPLWAFAAALALALKSLAFLAAGLVYRKSDTLSSAAIVAGVAVALVVAAAQTALLSTLVHAVSLLAAGVAFWPRRARLIALSLLAWGVLQLVFLLPVPAALEPGLLYAAALLQAVQSLALVMLVLDRARHQAEFTRSFNQKLLDGMDLGLALVGPDLRIEHSNRWMTERFGPDVTGGRCLSTYLARPEQCPECPWRDGTPQSRQLTVDGPGNRRFLLTCSPVTAPDGSAMLLELVSDITEQETMRARLLHSERLATVGEMASRVAHELRNPLTIMNVHADLIRRDLDDGQVEAVRSLAIVKGEIRRVAGLVDSYLRFGRLPAIQPKAVNLEDVLSTQLATLQAEFDVRGIGVKRVGDNDSIALLADGEQLGQVFANLFRNAIEAMPAGGTLTITTSCTDGTAIVEVADTGAGVGVDDTERIFRPFHTTKPLGAGLGLALAREIVQAHAGSLLCRTQDGGCFVVTLPGMPR